VRVIDWERPEKNSFLLVQQLWIKSDLYDRRADLVGFVNGLPLVFVCAMWTTGFDVPSCSTIYLDKPMKNHTLMQTIARANRVFPEKTNGLIVDYVGVFRNLEKALAIYAIPSVDDGSMPVRDKEQLVAWLAEAETGARRFCRQIGVDLNAIDPALGFKAVKQGDEALEKILREAETESSFLAHARVVNSLFKAILPDATANRFASVRATLNFLADSIKNLEDPVDVSRVLADVEQLLDESVAAIPYVIRERRSPDEPDENKGRIDLNAIDWQAVAQRFAGGKKRTQAERLRTILKA
jgi:type I restriction enzyme R subunit